MKVKTYMQNSTEFVIFVTYYKYLISYVQYFIVFEMQFLLFCVTCFSYIKAVLPDLKKIGFNCLLIIYYFLISSS